jgi:hypothetical protein
MAGALAEDASGGEAGCVLMVQPYGKFTSVVDYWAKK